MIRFRQKHHHAVLDSFARELWMLAKIIPRTAKETRQWTDLFGLVVAEQQQRLGRREWEMVLAAEPIPRPGLSGGYAITLGTIDGWLRHAARRHAVLAPSIVNTPAIYCQMRGIKP